MAYNTSKKILIKCVDDKPEVHSVHILNEDIDSIINDLKIG